MTLRRSAPRVRERWLGLVLAAAAATLLIASGVLANLAGSPFDAFDGNLVLNDETQDWVNAPNRQAGFDLPTGQNDNSFVQGTKEDTAIPVVEFGSIPNNKSDLLRFYVANEKVGGDEFLYLAWERVQEPNGTTNMDFEFNQSSTLSTNGVTPVRTPGDVLIKYDLAQGGTTPVLGYHRWVESGACEANGAKAPCWGPVQSLANNFEGSINAVAVNDPIFDADHPCDPADSPDCNTLSIRTFGEAAINLTDSGILPEGTCTGFGRAYLKSRSSDSFTAALKDFIAPIPVNIQNCGTIVIVKDAVPTSGQDFAYTTTGSGLSSFTLEDDGNEADEPMTPGSGGDWPNTKTFTNVQAGSYTVTETLPVANWSLTSLTCVDPSSNSSGNAATGVATINLAANETVTCTFENKKDATVTITKDAIPNALTDFPFVVTGAGWANFSLDDDTGVTGADNTLLNSRTFTFAAADQGAKSIDETTPSGWSLTGLTCSEGTSSTTTGLASFTVDPGDAITCTYTNSSLHHVIVIVCHTGTNTLAPSDVTLVVGAPGGGDDIVLTSIASAGALSQSDVCGLGGARFEGLPHEVRAMSVDVGSDAHPGPAATEGGPGARRALLASCWLLDGQRIARHRLPAVPDDLPSRQFIHAWSIGRK